MRNKKAFTLIEIITVITIIFILMSLSAGALKSMRNKAAATKTLNTFSILSKALMLYEDVFNTYPVIRNLNDQYKLYNSLSLGGLQIRNYKNEVIQTISEPFLNPEDMSKEKIIKKDGTDFLFYDAWGNQILYFFSKNDDDIEDNPYSSASPGKHVNFDYNIYDLISKGQDGASTLDNDNQKDDANNFLSSGGG